MSKKVIKGQNDKGSYDYLCKSIIVGDSAVGKTNIVLRFTEDTYKASHTATIGVDFKIKTLNIDGTKIKLQIWDTAGQCKFRNITRTYFKGAIAAIFAFSVTDRTSFENIGDWVRQSAESSDYTPIRILVGNKCDLKTQRIISEEEGRMLAQKYNMEYFDVSAKEGTNISTAFMRMGELMKQKVSKEDFRENIMPGVPIEKTSEPNKKCC